MRRVREWICLVLFRVVYPLALLACSIFRFNGFSMMYGAFALTSAIIRRPTPSSITKTTGSFLLCSTIFSGAALFAQSVFQIYVAVLGGNDGHLENCSLLESILRQIGLQKLGDSTALNATRIILPDVVSFLVSIFVYVVSRSLLLCNQSRGQTLIQPPQSHPSQSRLSKLMSQMVIFLGPGIVLILLALCGISTPSLIGSVYFLCFLVAITLWACGVVLGSWFTKLKAALLAFSITHLAATYISQMPFIQNLWIHDYYYDEINSNNTVLLERILGLKRLVYTNCTHSWDLYLYENNMWTDYLNVAVLITFFFVTGIEIRSRDEQKSSTMNQFSSVVVDSPGGEANVAATSDRDTLRDHSSPTRNYHTIDRGDKQPIASEDWLSRRSSSLESTQKAESSRRFEAFKGVAVSIGQFVLKQSYMATLIVMMAWSITYHSWLAFTFLVAACFIWMVPQKRSLCLRLSPFIVFYAECLLIISYIYGFDLTDEELPSHTRSGYNLSEIGLSKVQYPFVRLVVQTLFLLVFLFTLKYSQKSESDRIELSNLESINALRRTSIQANIQCNEIMRRLGTWVMSFLTKYWIIVCSLLFLLMALQDSVVYRIVYMLLFLFFITALKISYKFWRVWVKIFWIVVIIYSMVILFSIYILQFKDVMEKIHNSTGMSYDLMRDIGFEKYNIKDLFVSLLTPTSFLIVIILHLHYFQTKFLAISDVNRYRSALPPRARDDCKFTFGKTWKETMVKLVSLFQRYSKMGVVLLWRILEVHLFKVIAITIFVICAVDVCCLNVILALAVLILFPLGLHKILSLITMFFSSFIIVTRMLYQLKLVNEQYFITNCTGISNSTEDPHFLPIYETINGAHYFGYKKTDFLLVEVRNYIILVLLLAFESIISIHQEQYYNHPYSQKPKPSTIFYGISRRHADVSLISSFKFLANYGFYKFGKEICFISIVIVMVVRMDMLSLIYGFFLGLMMLLRRGICRAIWPGYLTILTIIIFIQYLFCLGLPPLLCKNYPWDLPPLDQFYPQNLKVFLFLPDYANPPYSIKLIADFFQVLLVCLQMKVFTQENKPEMIEDGGSNETIAPDLKLGKPNPTEDFILFKDSYLDYAKIGVFYYSYWFTLLILFITGTSRISLFCLGYLIGCFYFLWYGQDLLLKPIKHLNRIWSCMLLYCYGVLMVKCAFQLLGCVYYESLDCILVRLFGIVWVPVPSYFPPHLKKGCPIREDSMSLVWDSISFLFILVLLRIYKSWYFQHVVNELNVNNELASRGSELINEMTFKRVDTQKRFERNILDKIRLKVEKIRNKMQMQQSQAKAIVPYEDHYEVIRSGDYYMFDDVVMNDSPYEPRDDDSMSSESTKEQKPPTVAELFNLMSMLGMESAIEMWYTWQQEHRPKPTPSKEVSCPTDGGVEDDGDRVGDDDEQSDSSESQSKKSSSLAKKIKTLFKFLYITCWAGLEQLIIFTNGISREYICISNNLRQEKLKRKMTASQVRAQLGEPALIELAGEGVAPPPQATSPDKLAKNLQLEESRFREKLPLILKLFYSLFQIFLSHSELLCYFAMILNAMVYGSVLSIIFPVAAFLWATLSCPRPSKAFWLFAIGYTEAIIIIKYIFQFFDYIQSLEPTNVFYWPSVLGVTKEDQYAALDIFLLMCLFFHRSVLGQHGLWKDAETCKNDPQEVGMIGPGVASSPADEKVKESDSIDEEKGHDPEEGPSSSTSTTLRRRKKNKTDDGKPDDHDDDDETNVIKIWDVDDDGGQKDNSGNRDDGEDEESFNDEMKKICCNNPIFRPIFDYYDNLKNGTFRAATDVYVFMFLTDIITFLIAIFGFSSFGPTDPSISNVMVTTVLKKNKIPSVFLGMLLVQFIFIIIDRAIYLRKQVVAKLIFQVGLVILIHGWVFFGLPEITQKRFVENTTVQLWYFTKCIYLALSAYQIRSGYPTCILGNFLTKKYNYVNLYCFQAFLVIPFLHELRSLMDWMFTDTTLALVSWLQMEDIYSNVFCVKCSRSAEKRYKTPRGNKRTALVKYGLGGVVLFFLIFVIWFPLLLFGMTNAIFETNKPAEVSVSIKLAGYQQLFSVSTQELKEFTREDLNYFYATSLPSARTFLDSYQANDIFNISLKGESEATWIISPPSVKNMINSLNSSADVTMQFIVNFRRNPTMAAETVSAQFEKKLSKDDKMTLALLISGNSARTIVDIVNVFPRFLVVPASGKVVSADGYFTPIDNWSGGKQLTGNIQFDLHTDDTDHSVRWWTCNEFQANDSIRSLKKVINLTSFNERVAPSGVLSILTSNGVFGLYISFVLVVSRFLRMYIQGLSYKIMFAELPDPQALLTLCQDIYMVRETREFRLEEELFAQLIFLYRSPDTLLKFTKQKPD